MATPTPRDLHVDTLLTNISIGYKNPLYIADQIARSCRSTSNPTSSRSTGSPPGSATTPRSELPAPAPRAAAGTSATTLLRARYSYRIRDRRFEERDNADSVWNLEQDAVEFAKDKVDMRRERSLAAKIMTTGIWGNDDAGGSDFTAWSDYAGPRRSSTRPATWTRSRAGSARGRTPS
jgi:hypothetical protein